MSSKRIVFAFICSLCLLRATPSRAQAESGTLIVLESSPSEIVVAADSRTHNSTEYEDNRCKIAVLGSRVLFAASGNTGFGSISGGNLYWDAHKIAVEEFKQLHSSRISGPFLVGLARQWGKQVNIHLQHDVRQDEQGTLAWAQNNILTSGMFAAFDDGGHVSIVAGQIAFRKTGQNRVTFGFRITNNYSRPMALFLGETQIAFEIDKGRTPRGMVWKNEILRSIEASDDELASYAIQLIEFSSDFGVRRTISGQSVSMVGGPVDVVVLTRDRRITWIQQKAACREPVP